MQNPHLDSNSSDLIKTYKSSWRALVQSSTLNARELISYDSALKLKILPIDLTNRGSDAELLVAIPFGANKAELANDLKFLTNHRVTLVEFEENALVKAINSAYFKSLEQVLAQKLPEQLEDKKCSINISPSLERIELVPEILTNVLNYAFSNCVSDIHIESCKGGSAKIRFRSKGDLKNSQNLNLDQNIHESLCRFIKILCALDITEHRNPQEGMFETQFQDTSIRIRVSIIPSLYGTKTALRILHHYLLDELATTKIDRLKILGLTGDQETIFSNCILKKSGLILVSGPTGSGKSTLLYTLVEDYTPKNWNILSLEDPVEREISGITQIEADSQDRTSYYKSLKSLLRQDPDMLMISEIRDADVLFTAVQAALSGILVLSTIHASNTLELILRLFELGCTPVTLGSVLKFTSSQRLVPKNCSNCLKISERNLVVEKEFLVPPQTNLFESQGCQECCFEKKSGLVAVYETCIPTLEQVSQLYSYFKDGINSQRPTSNSKFEPSHFYSLNQSVRDLLIKGIISPITALQFCRL